MHSRNIKDTATDFATGFDIVSKNDKLFGALQPVEGTKCYIKRRFVAVRLAGLEVGVAAFNSTDTEQIVTDECADFSCPVAQVIVAVEISKALRVIRHHCVQVQRLRVGEIGVGDGNGDGGPISAEPAAEAVGVVAGVEVVVAGFCVALLAFIVSWMEVGIALQTGGYNLAGSTLGASPAKNSCFTFAKSPISLAESTGDLSVSKRLMQQSKPISTASARYSRIPDSVAPFHRFEGSPRPTAPCSWGQDLFQLFAFLSSAFPYGDRAQLL